MQVPSIRQKGRRSKADLLASATTAVTEEFIQKCLANDPCELGCLTRYLQPRPPLLPPSEREFAAAIADWREQLAASPNRGEAILDYLNQSGWIDRTAHGALTAKSNGLRCMIPRTECPCCMNCWGLAGDLNYFEADGHLRRGSMFSLVIASFNRGENEPQNIYSTQGNNRGQAWFTETEHFAHEERLLATRGYPQVNEHARVHAGLLRRAKHLRQRVSGEGSSTGSFGPVVEFVALDLVIRHLTSADRAFFEFLHPDSGGAPPPG